MALSTLLEIVTATCDELSLPRPATVISSTDPQVRTLLAHAQAAGRDLLRAHSWGRLLLEATCSTVASQDTYLFASCNCVGYYSLVSDTSWDSSNFRKMIGPDTPQADMFFRKNGTVSSINYHFRVIGSRGIKIWPVPTVDGDQLVFNYISSNWAIRSSDGATLGSFANDDDTTIFDPDLLKAEIKWRFLAGKGMKAVDAKMEAMEARAYHIAADIGGVTINLTPGSSLEGGFFDPSVPEANWNL